MTTLYPSSVTYRCSLCGTRHKVAYGTDPATIQHTCPSPSPEKPPQASRSPNTCCHLGDATDNDFFCDSCSGGTYRTFDCLLHQRETLPFVTGKTRSKKAFQAGFKVCSCCPDFAATTPS
jgi:hypothetical protein